jgi:ParB/RepB/Spo0J family partition protein
MTTAEPDYTLTVMNIGAIKVGNRHRRDLGDINELAASIAAIGLLHPIVVTPDGKLIAGERRLEAAKLLGWINVPVNLVDIDSIARGELAENACRKDFTPSELVAIARTVEQRERELARERMTLGKISTGSTGKSRDKVAEPLGLSGKTLEKACDVVEAAQREPDKFGHLVEEMGATRKVDRAFKQLQNIVRQEEHAKRIEHGCTVSDLITLADSGKRFSAIYADPPWLWETWGGASGKIHTAVDNHYGTSTIEEIAKLPVARLAADDCALVLWCTWPHIAIGTHIEIIQAWGFKPSTAAFLWVKQNPSGEGLHTGNGYYTRSNSEVCLIATKGSPLRLTTDVHQVVFAPVGEHSAKPEEVRRRIERLFPGPNLELYGRKLIPGWTVRGNEIQRDQFVVEVAA